MENVELDTLDGFQIIEEWEEDPNPYEIKIPTKKEIVETKKEWDNLSHIGKRGIKTFKWYLFEAINFLPCPDGSNIRCSKENYDIIKRNINNKYLHLDYAHSLNEIGKHLGISRERVRQIEAGAMKKLKHPKINKSILEYLETTRSYNCAKFIKEYGFLDSIDMEYTNKIIKNYRDIQYSSISDEDYDWDDIF